MIRTLGSIANRIFLTLLAGIIIAAGLTTWLAFSIHEHSLIEVSYNHTAERVNQILSAVDNISPKARKSILEASSSFGFEAQIIPSNTTLPESTNPLMTNIIKDHVGNDHAVVVLPEKPCDIGSMLPPPPFVDPNMPPMRHDRGERPHESFCREIIVSLQDKSLLKINLFIPRNPAEFRSRAELPLLSTPFILLFILFIGILAFVVSKIAARPIRHLANAASQLGYNIDHPPLKETGPREIRQAAKAFNAMQALIRDQIQHRTHILAAITHDLQTPLTRLRLRLEKVTDHDLQTKLLADLSVMQNMVKEGLDFAKSIDSAEKKQQLDIDSLLDSICADAVDAGQQVVLSGSSQSFITAQPHALRRGITNLIDNAVKYGQRAEIHISRQTAHVAIHISDHGTGIPDSQIDKVFEPFYRLENSRSRSTGGTGLGLTIAKNVIERNNGILKLQNRYGGGLEVIIYLPYTKTVTKKKTDQ